jgi:hypothetical protein
MSLKIFSNKITTPARSTRAKVPLHMKRAAEFWVDIFQSSLEILLVESINKNNFQEIAHDARAMADAALTEYENRWPGVRL